MYTVFLEDIHLKGFHGLYDEESISGNDFRVNVSVNFHASVIENIKDTINYAEVFEIVKSCFSQPHKLLETLAGAIIEEISKLNAEIKKITVSIAKLSAPIANYNGTVGITVVKDF